MGYPNLGKGPYEEGIEWRKGMINEAGWSDHLLSIMRMMSLCTVTS